MTPRTRFVLLLVSTPLVAFALIGGVMGKVVAPEETTYRHLRVFEDVVSLISNNYVEEADLDAVMDGAMRGLSEGLDADSAYLSAQDVAVLERNQTAAGDTGIELTRQYYLRVVSVRDGSPAARAGLRTGDYVRAIDGKATRPLSAFEGARLLRGPVGSRVKLTVFRGSAIEPHEVELVRDKLPAAVASGRMLDGGVGYVRVAAFEAGARSAVGEQVSALRQQGAEHLVIDLRGTAQGTYQSAIETARLFVAGGTLVQREARGKATEKIDAAQGDGAIALPVALLTTAGTAGPAEVFAASLVENKRAEIIGERTLGRTGIQQLVKLPDGSGLWLTTARYLTASGKAISGAGLEPALPVEEPDVEFGEQPPAGDAMLDKAVERLSPKKAA